MKVVNFRDKDMHIYRTIYSDNSNTAIILETFEHEMFSVATTNTGQTLPKNQAYIKDYSENTGMLDMLKREGIVTKKISERQSGFVTLELWELDLHKLKLIKN